MLRPAATRAFLLLVRLQCSKAQTNWKPGDIIYTGKPENVGPVVKGDVLLCKFEGLPDMSIRIT